MKFALCKVVIWVLKYKFYDERFAIYDELMSNIMGKFEWSKQSVTWYFVCTADVVFHLETDTEWT